MKLQLHETTWYSKWGTIFAIIILLPIATFFVGRSYQELKHDREQEIASKLALEQEMVLAGLATTTATSTASSTISAGSAGDNTNMDTALWNEYKSDELGFTIKYPKNVTIVPDSHPTSVTFTFPKEEYFTTVLKDSIVVSVYAEPTCSPMVYSPRRVEQASSTPSADVTGASLVISGAGTISENLFVNGINFIRNEQQDAAAGSRFETVTYDVIKNRVCYRIMFTSRGTNGAGFYESDAAKIAEIDGIHAKEYAHVKGVFSAMLSSFHFIDTPEGLNEASYQAGATETDTPVRLLGITPSAISVGENFTLTGTGFSGHDTLVKIYVDNGFEKRSVPVDFSVLWGGMPESDTKITLPFPAKACSEYVGASGLPCPWFTVLKSGKYFIFVQNQNGQSNTLPITVK